MAILLPSFQFIQVVVNPDTRSLCLSIMFVNQRVLG